MPEPTQILLDCLAMRRGEGPAPSLAGPIPAAAWDAVVAEATRHGVVPLLHARLRAAPVGLPAATRARLHAVYAHSAMRGAVIRRQLAAVLDALHAAGVPAIVLKGAHLVEAVYGDLALRPMADLDLLVRREDVGRGERALRVLGYRPAAPSVWAPDYDAHRHARPLVRAGAVPIELHRAVVDADAPFRLDVDGLWARSTPVVTAGMPARALSPEDLLIHLCVHAAHGHRFAVALLQLHDIALVATHFGGRLDWDRLAARANDASLGRVVFCALHLARDLLASEQPADDALRLLGHGRTDRELAATLRQYVLSERHDVPPALRYVWQGAGRPAARALAHALFPSRAEMRRMYRVPDGSPWLYAYYALRPFDVLARRGGIVIDVLARSDRARRARERERQRVQIDRWLAEHDSTDPGPPPRSARRR